MRRTKLSGGIEHGAEDHFLRLGASPFCIKVRAILDYKKITYTRVNPLGRATLEIRRRGKVGKVPALDIDGRIVVDSTDIAYELEKLFPSPAIIPSVTKERALCHALEDWCDESLYFTNLYYQWHDTEGRKNLSKAFGTSLIGRLFQARYSRLIHRQMKGQGTLRKNARACAVGFETPCLGDRKPSDARSVPARQRAVSLRFRAAGPADLSRQNPGWRACARRQ